MNYERSYTVSDIDDLMSLDPLELTADNIDAIIAYQRLSRETPTKAKKEMGPTPKIDLRALGLKTSVPPTKINRRV